MANQFQQPFPPQPVPPPESSAPQQPFAAATVKSPAETSDAATQLPKLKVEVSERRKLSLHSEIRLLD